MTQSSELKKNKLLRIGDLVKASGVSRTTIHYYTRQGLISPHLKTARNMAYYDRRCVEEVLLIKELRTRKFFPLSVIKTIMESNRLDRDSANLNELRSFLIEVFNPVESIKVGDGLSLPELMKTTGLSADVLTSLESIGLLSPWDTEQGKRYDDVDVQVSHLVRKLQGLGLTLRELQVYRQYVDAIRAEVKTMHDKIHHSRKSDNISIRELIETLYRLNEVLTIKICRKAVLDFHK